MMTTTSEQTTQAQWDTANRFLNQLLIDPTLANNYQQIIQQANGQEDAPEILTAWLQEQGYDTTPVLVAQALVALQNTSLAYWTGVYQQSFFEDNQPAPVLMIGPNTEGNATPYLDGVELKNYVFQSVKVDNAFHPTLSWNLGSNETTGNITFYYNSGITLDSNSSICYDLPSDYIGNWFEGKLQTSSSASPQKYYGAIEQTTDSSVDSQESSSSSQINLFVVIPFLVVFVTAIIIIGSLVYRAMRLSNDEIDEVEQRHDKFLDAIAENANYQKTIRALNKDYFYNENNDERNDTESQSETIDPQTNKKPEKPTVLNKTEQPKQSNISSQEGVVSDNPQGQQLHDKTINNLDPKLKETDPKSKDLNKSKKNPWEDFQ